MNVATRWTFGLLVPFATSCSWILDLPPPVDDHCRDDDGTLNCYIRSRQKQFVSGGE